MEIGYAIQSRSILPDLPGVYKFYNKKQQLIYVGKAKSLKKRVYSYFNKNQYHNRKTVRLVSEIVSFDFVIVNNETDALLLENNLIKQHQPRYNILLKDDKTFPYICIVKEPYPRIITTRKRIASRGEYYGPFSSVVAMNTVLDLIRKLHTIRTCKLNLSEKSLKKKPYKVCLEYHIGNCKGPCEGLQTEEDYNRDIQSAQNILKGNLTAVRNYFKEKMAAAAQQLKFEEAQQYKEKIERVDRFKAKSTVVNPKLSNLNVFTIVENENFAFVNYMLIENGAIINTRTVEVKKALEEPAEDILQTVAFDVLNEGGYYKLQILSNEKFTLGEVEATVPKIGDKKKLVQLSLRNGLEYKKNKMLKSSVHDKSAMVLGELKKDLGLKEIPDHIECFDNSNFQGTNPVAAMVCFKNGRPSKKDYRHYNIKTVEGPDDFASMKEVVGRRYGRLIKEGLALPQLIVIDGGKGQLKSAGQALKELDIYGRIPIVGIAKRLEEIYFPEDQYPLHISKKSVSLKLLQHLRDEAHRFAITFHRNKRSKASLTSKLTDIKGIGAETCAKLLKTFRSLEKIKKASLEEISQTIGSAKGLMLYNELHHKEGMINSTKVGKPS